MSKKDPLGLLDSKDPLNLLGEEKEEEEEKERDPLNLIDKQADSEPDLFQQVIDNVQNILPSIQQPPQIPADDIPAPLKFLVERGVELGSPITGLEPPTTTFEEVKAHGEVAINMLTSLPAAFAGTIAGAWESATQQNIQEFPEAFEETMEEFMYSPQTVKGQEYVYNMGELFTQIADVRKMVGNAVFEATSGTEIEKYLPDGAAGLATDVEVTLAGLAMFGPLGSAQKRTAAPLKPKDSVDAEMQLVDTVRKEYESPARIAQTSTERGHISRAQRIAERDGISYGEAIEQVVMQTKNPDKFKHLLPKHRQGDLRIAADERTFLQMKESVFQEIPSLIAPENVEIRPLYPDISPLRRDVSAIVAPGKFVADLHPVLKWGIDRIESSARTVELTSKEILYAPELQTRKVGTIRRKATPTPTNRGALTSFTNLNKSDQIKLLEDARVWDSKGVEPTIPMMEELGWNKSMIHAYGRLREGTQTVRQMVNQSAVRTGAAEGALLTNRPGYLPRVWDGDFRIYVKDADGQLVKMLSADTKPGAKFAVSRLQKEFPDYTIGFFAKKRSEGGESLDAFRDAIKTLGKDSDEAILLEKAYSEIIKDKGFKVHKKERAGVDGYMGSEGGKKGVSNFIRGYQRYIEGGLRYAENMKMAHDVNKVLVDRDIAQHLPNVSKALERFRDNAVGKDGFIEKTIKDWTRESIGESKISSVFGSTNYLTLISNLMIFNPRFLAANVVQPYMVVPAKLMNLKSQGIQASVSKAVTDAAVSMVKPSKEDIKAIQYAFKSGSVNPKFIHEGTEGRIGIGKAGINISQKTFETMTGQRLAGRVEEYARMQAYLQFYHYLKASKLSPDESMKGAAYLTDKYMVEYTSVTRPLIFGQTIGGSPAKPFGLFKTFQHNYLAQQVEHVKAAASGKGGKGLAMFVGAQVLGAGLQGVIAIEQADFLLNSMGLPTLTDSILRSDTPDWITWGIPSSALGADITTTLAAPGVGVQNFISVPGYEYLGKIVEESFDYSLKSWKARKNPGALTPTDRQEFWSAVAPTSMQGIIEKYYSRDNLAIVSNRGKVKIFERDNQDWYARFMSSRSLEESRQLRATWQMTILDRNAAANVSSLVDVAAWSVITGDEYPEWAMQEAFEKWDTNPADFNKRVLSRAQSLVTTTLDQITSRQMTLEGFKKAEEFRERGVDVK